MSDKPERKDIDKSQIDWNQHAEYWNEFDEAIDYTQHIVRLLSNRINIKNLDILELGCGTGLLIDHMTKDARQIVAVDTADKMIQVLDDKKYKNVITINDELSEQTIKQYPALQQKFDLILAVSVCAFLPNYQEVLKIIKSSLNPNGIFIQWDWLRNEREPDFGFTEDLLRENYQQAGLTVESIDIPFYMEENDEKMEVIMAIGTLKG